MSSVATEEMSSSATEEMSSVATEEMSPVATEEMSSVATEDMSSILQQKTSLLVRIAGNGSTRHGEGGAHIATGTNSAMHCTAVQCAPLLRQPRREAPRSRDRRGGKSTCEACGRLQPQGYPIGMHP